MIESNITNITISDSIVAAEYTDPVPIAYKMKEGKLWGLYRKTQGFHSATFWKIVPELTEYEIENGKYI